MHHDIWDYDAASPVVLFDTVINGVPRKGIAEAGRTGWVYILDRTNGKPLIGIEERPVPQEPRQKTAKTQPYPIGDATVPQCVDEPMPGYDKVGCIFETFWETPVLIQPSGIGGTNWSPMPYSPDTGYFYVPGTVRTSAFTRYGDKYVRGQRYVGGTQAAPIGSTDDRHVHGDQLADQQDRLAAQDAVPHRRRRRLDGNRRRPRLPRRARRQFFGARRQDRRGAVAIPDRFGADAPPVVYEVDGEQYITIATGGNQLQGSSYGDAIWTFSLKGQLGPLWAPPPPANVAGPVGPIAPGADCDQDRRQQRGIRLLRRHARGSRPGPR